MHWIILLISSVLEAVWAIALSESDGFSRPVPTIVFAVAVTLSMIGLGYAMKGIPTSVAYTVWVGVGAALTVTASMLTGSEDPSPQARLSRGHHRLRHRAQVRSRRQGRGRASIPRPGWAGSCPLEHLEE